MTKLTGNVHAYADGNYAVWVAPLGAANPGTLPPVAVAGADEIGVISDAGIAEGHNLNETKVYDMSGALVRVLRNQEEWTWQFSALESNAQVAALRFPNSTLTTTGGTAEVQTVTITGTPTGGTFTLSLPNGGTASGLVYNIAPTALATALTAAFDIPVTVTGTAGSSYVVTFPVAEGNVGQMNATSQLTGGTTPTIGVATTTPGVTGVNTRAVGSGTSRNLRSFFIDLVDGNFHERLYVPQAEAVQSGTTTYGGNAVAEYQFTVTAYKDGAGNFFYRSSDDQAQGQLSV